MNLEKIRNMNDDELRKYINELSKKNNIVCVKCGATTERKDRKNITVSISEKYNYSLRTKKLCSLCNECYAGLLEYLGTEDIDWEV